MQVTLEKSELSFYLAKLCLDQVIVLYPTEAIEKTNFTSYPPNCTRFSYQEFLIDGKSSVTAINKGTDLVIVEDFCSSKETQEFEEFMNEFTCDNPDITVFFSLKDT